jgi:para-nitrobenzyl esterase
MSFTMPKKRRASRIALALAFAVSASEGCSDDQHKEANEDKTAAEGGSADVDAGAAEDPLLVRLAAGKVEGELVDGARRFLKIPYAKPPIGELRWKAPVESDSWTNVRHETAFADPCPQTANTQNQGSTAEDCLYLNVWSPDPPPERAPVMIWIHGGGNVSGSAADKLPVPALPVDQQPLWYDGKLFASKQGVVLVTFNYRLGAFGFFAHPALRGEGSPVGNQGLLDQREVMRWVQGNIAKFGGDPDNVTIFGESAGSGDVCYHIASPGSRDLFQRAISESGGCTTSIATRSLGAKPDPTVADLAPLYESVDKALGCDSAPDRLACLRAKPVADVLAAAGRQDPMNPEATASFFFGVAVDGPGGFLPEQARTLFERGQIAKVPYLMGSNNDEGKLFVLTGPMLQNEADFMAELKRRFGDFAPRIAAQYPASKFDGNYKAALARIVGDFSAGCGTHDTARRAVHAGLRVFLYNFNIPWEISPVALGASHAAEMSHVFGLPWMPDEASQRVADAMNRYWATFARTGDPNFEGAPAQWPEFRPAANDDDRRLQLAPDWSVLESFRKEECALWREYYAQ